MMSSREIPYGKLSDLRDVLGLTDEDVGRLSAWRGVFTGKKEEFADYFFNAFLRMPETRNILEHEERPGFLKKAWAHWFESLFEGRPSDEYVAYLWRIGIRHVEVNLDHRFSCLGFSLARQFCRRIVESSIPPGERLSASLTIDRLIDFCLLVETSAYIDATTRCDIEIIKGVADKIRNRIMVIGGNVRRLQKRVPADDPSYGVYDFLITESSRCERMVSDITAYNEVFQKEPKAEAVSLEGLVGGAVERLKYEGGHKGAQIDVALDHEAPLVLGDPDGLNQLFYYILQHSLEALDKERPYIRITSVAKAAPPRSVVIEVFNTGRPPSPSEIEKMYTPFYSTKTEGTGFALPIAQMVAKKNFGKLVIEPAPRGGTNVVVTLPLPREEGQ